jgi:hypothetical protein
VDLVDAEGAALDRAATALVIAKADDKACGGEVGERPGWDR